MKTTIKIFVCLTLCSGTIFAQDWPQWRHDARNSAVTEGTFSTSSKAMWNLDLGKPSPAYIHQFRMCADATYSPISAEGLLFVPSNVSDQLTAFDLDSGETRWRYMTEGPVRYAPAYQNGKVYLTSDDGYLHCLQAASGELIWKTRGVPAEMTDSLMLVNGRMVSRWPSRGAAVLYDGMVYFGNGVWPEEGVFVTAVNAETGEVIWQTNDMAFIENGISDHGVPYDIGLPPNGYGAVIDGKLAVTCGRALAVWLDPKTGERDPYTTYYVKFKAGRGVSSIAGTEDFSVQGGNWFGTRADSLPPHPEQLEKPNSLVVNPSGKITTNESWAVKNRPFAVGSINRDLNGENFFADPVVENDTIYESIFEDEGDYRILRGHTYVHFPEYDKIVARDLSNPQWKLLEGPASWAKSQGSKFVGKTMTVIEFPVLWEMKSTLKVQIKVGDHLIAAGDGKIAAIKIPQGGEEPRFVWEQKVEGVPVHTIFADGKLVTVTDQGRMYVFGDGPRSSPDYPTHALPNQSPHKGFAAIIGWRGIKQAEFLLDSGTRRVVVLENQPEKVAAARKELTAAGLYGRGIQVIQVREGMHLPPYWASDVKVNREDVFGSAQHTYETALTSMRPFNGRLNPAGPGAISGIKPLIEGKGDYEIRDGNVYRTRAPDGAGEWTHEASDPSNSFISEDKLVRWPLGMLWYSGEVDNFFTPESHYQHERQPHPLVKDGRMFIITGSNYHAVDIYTGNYLWEKDFGNNPYFNSRLVDARVHGRPTERNYVVADDYLYVITGEKVVALDVATGNPEKEFTVPEEIASESREHAKKRQDWRTKAYKFKGTAARYVAPLWTEFRLWNETIISVVGKRLIAIDRSSGKMLWSREGTKEHMTYTMNGDTVFALDCTPESLLGSDNVVDMEATLTAIDPRDGGEIWSAPYHYTSLPKNAAKAIKAWVPDSMPFIGYNKEHDLLVTQFSGNNFAVLSAKDGHELWRSKGPKIGTKKTTYAPLIMNDVIVANNYNKAHAVALDIMTGKVVSEKTPEMPFVRACARVIGNENIVMTRDNTVIAYDFENKKVRHFNSLRAGCTSNYVPAGGILTAPMLAHGCVCNFPMFISLAMHHIPQADDWRPKVVTDAWDRPPRKKGAPTQDGPGGEKKTKRNNQKKKRAS